VNIPGFANAGNAQVSILSFSKTRCLISHYPYSQSNVEEIQVECRNSFGLGSHVDVPFMVQFTD
jgi:hypothetical protein